MDPSTTAAGGVLVGGGSAASSSAGPPAGAAGGAAAGGAGHATAPPAGSAYHDIPASEFIDAIDQGVNPLPFDPRLLYLSPMSDFNTERLQMLDLMVELLFSQSLTVLEKIPQCRDHIAKQFLPIYQQRHHADRQRSPQQLEKEVKR